MVMGLSFSGIAQVSTVKIADIFTTAVTTPSYSNAIFSFTTAKNDGTTAPVININDYSLRLYKPASGKTKGGQIAITPKDGITFTKVEYNNNATCADTGWKNIPVENNSATFINTTSARIDIFAIRVTYTTGGGEITTVPELPIVTFNGITAEDCGSYEVEKGTEVSVSSKNATTIYVNKSTITGGKFTVNETGDYDIYGENSNGESDHFRVNFTLKETPVIPSTGNTYKLITSENDLQAGCKYIIVASGKKLTMNANNTETSAISSVSVSINNDIIEAGSDVLVFELGKSGTAWTLKTVNYNKGNNFLNATSSGTALKIGSASTFSIKYLSATRTQISLSGSTREILLNGTNFKHYASSNATTSGYSTVQLYKQVINEGPATYEPEFAAIPVLFTGDTHQIIVPGDKHPAVNFTSNNPGVATVTADGLVTAISAGTTSITAKWEDSDEWIGSYATLSVAVRTPLLDPELSFRHATITGKINVGVAAQAAYHKSDGKITYTSSNPEIVTVSERTGMITPADVHAVGTATITATIAETDVYKSASASYTVVIQRPDFGATAPAGNYRFDFRTEGAYDMFAFTNSNCTNGNIQYYENTAPAVNGVEHTPVTMVLGTRVKNADDPENVEEIPVELNLKGDYRNWYNNGYHLRFYAAAASVGDESVKVSSMTFSVPDGYSIEKILFNADKIYYDRAFTADCGEFSIGSTDEDTEIQPEIDVNAVWKDTDNTDPQSVTLTRTGDDFIAIKTITVVLKKAESERVLADLSFNTRVYNTYVGEKTEINAVTSPNIGIEGGIPYSEIKYSIDNLDGNDYFVGRDNEADGKLDVTVLTPGVYTFRVNSGASDKYLRGVAILRLNVFPKVTVNAPEAQEMTNDFVVLPAEGGTIDFGELPSTLELMIKQDGDADFTAHDGSAIQITGDRTIEYHMLYAETYAHGHTTLTVVTMPVVPTVEFSGSTHTITASANAELHYSPIKEYRRKPKTAVALAAEETTWNVTTEPLNINIADYKLTENDYIYFDTKSVKNTAVKALESPIKRMLLTNTGMLTSGVEDIEISGDSRVRFFNLNGIEADADNMAPGMYIRVSGGKAEKVIVK